MSNPKDQDENEDAALQTFVRSLLAPVRALGGHHDLGSTALARQLDLPTISRAATGAAAARASGTAARSKSSARNAAIGTGERAQTRGYTSSR